MIWPTAGAAHHGQTRAAEPHPESARGPGWPTPTGDDANNVTRSSGQFQSLARAVFTSDGGAMNATWVETVLGWPAGWTL